MNRLVPYLLMTAGCMLAPGLLAAQNLSGEKILLKVKEQYDLVTDYSVNVAAAVNLERMKIPKTEMKIFYKQPDKIHVEAKGFSMIPKEAVRMNPLKLLDKFSASVESRGDPKTSSPYVLKLIPVESETQKKREPLSAEYRVWVDPLHWTIIKFETAMGSMGNVVVELEQTEVDGKYFLPSSVKVSFQASSDSLQQENERPRARRSPLRGSVTLRYSEYKVNTGLSDEIFISKDDKNK